MQESNGKMRPLFQQRQSEVECDKNSKRERVEGVLREHPLHLLGGTGRFPIGTEDEFVER